MPRVPTPNAQLINERGWPTPPLLAWMNGINSQVAGIPCPQVNVLAYGAVGDGVTDDTAAIQQAIDENPTSEIWFPHGTYLCSETIVLSDAAGRRFLGRLVGQRATITFSNAGNSFDDDINMARGFAAYPTNNGAGGDISGMDAVSFFGFNIVGPTNGACIYLANCIRIPIEECRLSTSRYGVAMECSIQVAINNCYCVNQTNAGVGMIMTSDTARVWYGSATPTASYYNECHLIMQTTFANSDLNSTLAYILDTGSMSGGLRTITDCDFFSNWSGSGPFISTQYGYLGRNANPTFRSNYLENINYPFRLLNSDANEGGGDVTGVAGAQPDGTYAIANFVDGYSYSARIESNQFFKGLIDINVNGVSGGPCFIGNNLSARIQVGGVHIYSAGIADSMIVDAGDVIYSPLGAYSYRSTTGDKYTYLPADWVTWTPTITASSGSITAYTVNDARWLRRAHDVLVRLDVTITTNGTGAGSVQATLPFTAAGNGSVIPGRETVSTGHMLQGRCLTTTMSIFKYDNTYPAVSGSRLVLSGVVEVS